MRKTLVAQQRSTKKWMVSFPTGIFIAFTCWEDAITVALLVSLLKPVTIQDIDKVIMDSFLKADR